MTIHGDDCLETRLKNCSSATSPSRLPGLDRALNPYRGCAHSCAYCYAQDVTRFEMTRAWGSVVEVKTNLVQLLKKELARGPKGVYGIGTVTDPYQPLEKRFEVTRGSLVLLRQAGARASILTKSDLVLRDLDLLASWSGAEVGISISCLDNRTASIIEPGAPSPRRRLEALRRLSNEGVRAYLMAAPIISGLSDTGGALRALVHEAHANGVPSIMWDKFNPKPLATARLRRALADAGLPETGSISSSDMERIRSVLSGECAACGIELLDAF